MAEKSIAVTLRANIEAYQAAMGRAAASTKQLGREISGMGANGKADLEKVGRGALLVAGGLAAGLGLSAKAAIDWESAWAGVTKTVDGSASQMADLEAGLRDLAKELPATHGEIAAVAEAAGQLGIQREAIEGFTKTMIDLGETTNLTADQAATAMARMANIMQTPQTEIDRMASTLVALGNAGASTESEILDMSLRIAGAARQVGITEAETLAFANALSSVGVEAEAGGTAISRVFSTIASAVAEGGEAVEGFADVAGMSAEEFSTAFREDAAGATVAFIEGLAGIKAEGGNVFAVLEQLELGDIRVRDALLRAAGAGDLFRESLALGADEWERNNALQTEAEKRYDTTAAKLEVARNQVVDLGINLGGVLLPAIASVADGLSTMVQGFSEMPGPMETVVVGIGGLATAGLGAVAAAALLIPKIQAMRTALMGMGTAGAFASKAIPWLAAAAAAVGAVSFVFGQSAKKAEEAEERAKGYTDAIREAGDATTGTTDQITQFLKDTPVMAEILDEMGSSASDMGAALSGSDADFAAFTSQMVSAAEAAGYTGIELDVLRSVLNDQRDAALEGATNAETLGRVLDDTGDAAAGAAPKLGGVADKLGLNADEAKRAREELEDLLDAYRAAVDPLFGMLDALDANREAQAAESEARAEGLRAVADAADDLSEAESDLADARAKPDNAEGIAAAERRVADARERLTEAQADAVISAEELAQMNRDVAESALDVEIAARELAAAVQDGTVSVDAARSMLNEWVEQGLLTEEQAANVAEQFGIAAGKADEFAGDWTANAYLHAPGVQEALDRMVESMRIIAGGTSMVITGGSSLARERKAVGGRAGTGPFGVGPAGTDVIPAMLSAGEYVVNAPAAQAFGYGNLDAINAGRTPIVAAGGMGGSTSHDNSRHIRVDAPITVRSADPHRSAMETRYALRQLEVELR